MQIYIASSWKNQHAVEMLTDLLRRMGHQVRSFVENNFDEGHGPDKPMPFEDWVRTEQAERSFEYDTKHACESDLVIYIAPSGTDAWAEVGAAWACGRQILGLWSKGEPAGLMRKMVEWFPDHRALLAAIPEPNKSLKSDAQKTGAGSLESIDRLKAQGWMQFEVGDKCPRCGNVLMIQDRRTGLMCCPRLEFNDGGPDGCGWEESPNTRVEPTLK